MRLTDEKLRDNIIESIKDILLPEIRKLEKKVVELGIRQEAVERLLSIMNQNIMDNSRCIDETNNKMDATVSRLDEKIDETNKRIDYIYNELANVKDELTNIKGYMHDELANIKVVLERLRREDFVTSDILHRLGIMEEKILLGR